MAVALRHRKSKEGAGVEGTSTGEVETIPLGGETRHCQAVPARPSHQH